MTPNKIIQIHNVEKSEYLFLALDQDGSIWGYVIKKTNEPYVTGSWVRIHDGKAVTTE